MNQAAYTAAFLWAMFSRGSPSAGLKRKYDIEGYVEKVKRLA